MYSGQGFVIKGGDLSGPKKKIAVIGCGISGLVSMKTAVEYGHNVVGFERLADIGGIWNYQVPDTSEGYTDLPGGDVPCYPMYSTLMTNSSQYTTIFSDFLPLKKGENIYPMQREVGDYAKDYASHFNLLSNIKLETHVNKLDKQGRKWYIHYRCNDVEDVEEFDFVMVCTGGCGFPRQYDIKGSESFTGIIINSSQVRDGGKLFKDKTVFMLGGANSAGEMLNMALPNVKKMYVHFTDREKTASVWGSERFVKTVYGDKRPMDLCFNRENKILHPMDAPKMIAQWMVPFQKCSPNAEFTVPNDIFGLTNLKNFHSAKSNGVIEIVSGIREVDGNTIHLQNGGKVENVDIILISKGFYRFYPYLDHIWPREKQDKFIMYNYTVSPDERLDGLGFLLMIFAAGPLVPLAELQARWFTHKIISRAYDDQGRIFDANERQDMQQCVAEKLSKMPEKVSFNYVENLIGLFEHLATDIGANPPDFQHLIESGDEKQVELGVALAYGPFFPIQYRIKGPHAWPEASEVFVKQTREFLGHHFDEYVEKVKKNDYPKSAYLG